MTPLIAQEIRGNGATLLLPIQDDDTTDLKPMPPSSNPSTTAGGGRDRWMVVAAGMSYPDSGGSQSSVMGMPCRNLNPTPRPRTTTLITRG